MSTQFLLFAVSALVGPGQRAPLYKAELLPLPMAVRINAKGNTIAAAPEPSICIDGKVVRFRKITYETHSHRRSITSTLKGFMAINDLDVVLGAFDAEAGVDKEAVHKRGVFLYREGMFHWIALPFEVGYGWTGAAMNNQGQIVFTSLSINNDRPPAYGFRLTGESFEYLPYRGTGAIGSSVTGLDPKGNACGTLIHGQPGTPHWHEPVVWTDKNEIIFLELPKGANSGFPMGLRSPDLVWGLISQGSASKGVMWKKGELVVFDMPKGSSVSMLVLKADGTPIVTIKKGTSERLFQRVGKEWISVEELVQGLPKGVKLIEAMDIATNDIVLVWGQQNGARISVALVPLSLKPNDKGG